MPATDLIELPKYNVSGQDLKSAKALEQWVFFLNSAAECEAEDLRRLLPGSAYQNATGVLEKITRSPGLRLVNDDRAKEEQDRIALRVDSLAEGIAQGEAKGHAEGEAKGKLIGQVQLLQRVLNLRETSNSELSGMNLSSLESLAAELELKLNSQQK